MQKIKQKIHDTIDGRSDELVQLTQDLVAFPTLNPPGAKYLDCLEFLHSRFLSKGLRSKMVRAEGSVGDSKSFPRWNLISRIDGNSPGECIHFNSHIDVVEVGHGWTKDPFKGTIEDGKIYGRGTCDMKGGLATSIIALEAFLSSVESFTGAIEISATADEESGGYSGVAWLTQHGFITPNSVQHVIIPEPLHKDRICLGHRGVWWAEIETYGKIAHGSMPFLGDCAVRHMVALIHEFENKLIPKLKNRTTSLPVVPVDARRSSINFNSIHGGEPDHVDGALIYSAPCVPDRCKIRIDRRFLPEESLDEVKDEVINILDGLKKSRKQFEYTLTDLFSVPSVITNQDQPIVKAVQKSIEELFGKEPEFVISPGTYDQKHFANYSNIHNCIAYGPGLLELAHQPDEWIGIQDMIDSAKVMASTMVELLVKE